MALIPRQSGSTNGYDRLYRGGHPRGMHFLMYESLRGQQTIWMGSIRSVELRASGTAPSLGAVLALLAAERLRAQIERLTL